MSIIGDKKMGKISGYPLLSTPFFGFGIGEIENQPVVGDTYLKCGIIGNPVYPTDKVVNSNNGIYMVKHFFPCQKN